MADKSVATTTDNLENAEPTQTGNETVKSAKMGWINYFRAECSKLDGSGKKKSRQELGQIYRQLPDEEKAKYGEIRLSSTLATQVAGPETEEKSNDVEEDLEMTEKVPAMEGESLQTRCSPSRFCRVLNNLTADQKETIRGVGFGNLLLLNCGRLQLRLCRWLVDNFDIETCTLKVHGQSAELNDSVFGEVMGIPADGDDVVTSTEVPDLEAWGQRIKISHGKFCRKSINSRLNQLTSSDDEFAITFCLFLLGTILAPTNVEYVPVGYLNALLDVASIGRKNWASWCFRSLCNGIRRFKTSRESNQNKVLSGCVLFLQMFYVHSIQLVPSIVDRSVVPIVGWTRANINKCLVHVNKEGGFDSDKIRIGRYLRRYDGPSDLHSDQQKTSADERDGFVQHTSCRRKHVDDVQLDALTATVTVLRNDFQSLVREVQLVRHDIQDVKAQVDRLVEHICTWKEKNSPPKTKVDDFAEQYMPETNTAGGNVSFRHLSTVDPSSSRRPVFTATTPPIPGEPQEVPPPPHALSPQASKHLVRELSSTNTLTKSKSTGKKKTSSSDMWAHIDSLIPLPNYNVNELSKQDTVDSFYQVHEPIIVNAPTHHAHHDELPDHELQSNSSSQLTIMKTRSASSRKPSTHVLSPYMVPHPRGEKAKTFRYGPFRLVYELQDHDRLVIEYIYDKDLDASEHIIDTDNLQVSRESFKSLEPKKSINSEIISAQAEYKNIIMRANEMKERICWYFPTYFQYAILNCKADNMPALKKSLSNFKQTYMTDIDRCERIYIPINDQRGHWFLGVVHIDEKKAEVWDSCAPRRKSAHTPRVAQLKRMLVALDFMVGEDIAFLFEHSFAFTNFTVVEANAPQQPNGYDCGMFVCMFMDDTIPTAEQLELFDSTRQRLLFARYLALFPGNKMSLSITQKAQARHNELVKAKLKRKLPDRQVPPVKRLSKRALRHLL